MENEDQAPLFTREQGLLLRDGGIREAEREADFVASTDALDSWDEIVEQVWDLKRYLANPIVLYAHQSRELPIGTARNVGVVDGELVCTIKFVTAEMNPKAEQVWQMVQSKVLRGVSVGFRPQTTRFEKRDGKEVYVLSDNVLHEISVVPIPANPEALAKAKAKAFAEAANHPRTAAPAATDAAKAAAETSMSEHEKALAEERDAHKKTLQELNDARTALTTAESHAKAMADERDKAVARAVDAEAKIIELEVGALVGVKITPAEKDDYVALRKSNPDLFERFVAQKSDLNLLDPITKDADAPPPKTVGAGAEEPDLTAG